MKVRKSVKLADDLPNGKDVDKPAVSVEQQSENAADMPNGKGVDKPTNLVIVPRSRDSDKSVGSLAWDIQVRAVLVPVYRYTVSGIKVYW